MSLDSLNPQDININKVMKQAEEASLNVITAEAIRKELSPDMLNDYSELCEHAAEGAKRITEYLSQSSESLDPELIEDSYRKIKKYDICEIIGMLAQATSMEVIAEHGPWFAAALRALKEYLQNPPAQKTRGRRRAAPAQKSWERDPDWWK